MSSSDNADQELHFFTQKKNDEEIKQQTIDKKATKNCRRLDSKQKTIFTENKCQKLQHYWPEQNNVNYN